MAILTDLDKFIDDYTLTFGTEPDTVYLSEDDMVEFREAILATFKGNRFLVEMPTNVYRGVTIRRKL